MVGVKGGSLCFLQARGSSGHRSSARAVNLLALAIRRFVSSQQQRAPATDMKSTPASPSPGMQKLKQKKAKKKATRKAKEEVKWETLKGSSTVKHA